MDFEFQRHIPRTKNTKFQDHNVIKTFYNEKKKKKKGSIFKFFSIILL